MRGLRLTLLVVALVGITMVASTQRVVVAQTVQLCRGLEVTVDIGAGETPTSEDDVILGTADDDTIHGGSGDDTVCGGAGNDTIYGEGGADVIYGQGGDDSLVGGCESGDCGQDVDDKDVLIGGIGDDNLRVSASNPKSVARGGPGEDTLNGAGILYGGSDNDTIFTLVGSEAHGQSGDDELIFSDEFGSGEISMFGGSGDDYFDSYLYFGPPGVLKITMEGGGGGDRFFTGSADHVVDGGTGDDEVYLATGNLDVVRAGSGDDNVSVELGDFSGPQVPGDLLPIVVAFGNGGKDVLTCASGFECMFYGGPGDDDLTGSDQNDILSGNDGNDCLAGHGGDDTIRGHSGNDELYGGSGNDTVQGGVGDDIVLGANDSGGFVVRGNSGFDECDDLTHPSCEVTPVIIEISCESGGAQ